VLNAINCNRFPTDYDDCEQSAFRLFSVICRLSKKFSFLLFRTERLFADDNLYHDEIKVNEHILDDDKYLLIFSVERVNRLAREGMPFRDAYKKGRFGY
jgi:hypothetical protein